MHFSELRPCDKCHKPVGFIFYLVRISLALVDVPGVHRLMGTAEILGGVGNPGALAVASTLAGEPEITVCGEKEPSMFTTLVLCLECHAGADINLGHLGEIVTAKLRATATKTAGDTIDEGPPGVES